MSVPSFTPGPWTIKQRKNNRILAANGLIIGEAWVPPSRLNKESKKAAWNQAASNARLMASSPELYAELSKLISTIETDLPALASSQQIVSAKAVIAKARGYEWLPARTSQERAT